MATNPKRDKIVKAFLALLAERPFERISVMAVAERASVSLADMRAEFGSTFDMLAAFLRDIDEKTLAGGDPELAESPARERLFDVLMRRIEALKPHREAVRSLARSVRRDPALALALNRMSLRSQQWMLAAAGIDTAGLQGCVRAQGLVLVMARTLNVFVDDDDPGLARTMAKLDRELASGERWLNLFDDLCGLVPRWAPRRRARRRDAGAAEPETFSA
jgi:AcrR family transcriptional regulator